MPPAWNISPPHSFTVLVYSWWVCDMTPRPKDPAIREWTCQSGGGSAMTFEEIVDQALAMLQRRGRVAYRTLKRQFQLDEDALEDLKTELIDAQQVAADEDGKVLVWTGARGAVPRSAGGVATARE